MTTYRIVRRVNSEYTTIETLQPGVGYIRALLTAERLQTTNRDGEYLVRELHEPDHSPRSSFQSGMDWL